MNNMQEHNFDQHRHCFRATHVKTQAIVKGTLTVLPNLPSHLQQGLFKTPGKIYDVVARYSSEPVFLQADQEPGPRGLGLRVFGVTGERPPSSDQEDTVQDFLFNNAPMIELKDLPTCLDIMALRERYFDALLKLSAATKIRNDALNHAFYTQGTFRFGSHYRHISLVPMLDSMTSQNEAIQSGDSREALKEKLSLYFRSHGAKYELRIQLATSSAHHPTEDGPVLRDEATAPYQSIATVEFPPQDTLNPARRRFWEDRMRLNPWDALAEHQPLGSINRLRRKVYAMSVAQRSRINDVETTSVDRIDQIPN